MNPKPIQRILEPEVMDPEKEAVEYDEMDHSEVNRIFVEDLLFLLSINEKLTEIESHKILDVGTGTALIPRELCQRDTHWKVIGIDFSKSMLDKGSSNIQEAGLQDQIELIHCDAKATPFENASYSIIISNSIVHHIPKPTGVIKEMVRLLQPGGVLFIRDLLRPETNQDVESIVDLHAANANEYQRQLFRQSLQAALTVQEIEEILVSNGIPKDAVIQTSDRHWTIQYVAQTRTT